jgi:hypothetical protein
MAGKGKKSHPKGTLIRGSDGALYFISYSKLQAFRVPADEKAEVDRELEALEDDKKTQVDAVECNCIEDLLRVAGRRKPPRK